MKEQKEKSGKQSRLPLYPKEKKYVGVNLPKGTKDLYSENYKTLMKEIKMTRIDGKIYHALGLEESFLSK